MSLSSPSPSWFAKTPYCSVRDWTRFLRHRIKKYPDSPVHTLSDSLRIYFFPLWRTYLFFDGFAVEFAGYVWTVAVSGTKKLRIRKYPDTCGRGLSQRGQRASHINDARYEIKKYWACRAIWANFFAWQVVSLTKNERPSQTVFLKVDPRSTFHNNFLQPTRIVFVGRRVGQAREKNSWKHQPKGATKQCCATSWRFL